MGFVGGGTFSLTGGAVTMLSAATTRPQFTLIVAADMSARLTHVTAPACAVSYSASPYADPAPPPPPAALGPAPTAPAHASGGRPFLTFFSSSPLGCWMEPPALGASIPAGTISGWRDLSGPIAGATNARGDSAYIQQSPSATYYNAGFMSRKCTPADAAENQVDTAVPGADCRIVIWWAFGGAGAAAFGYPALPVYGVLYNGLAHPWLAAVSYSSYLVNETVHPGKKYLEQKTAGCPDFYTVSPPPDPQACARQGLPFFELAPASFGGVPGTELATAVFVAAARGFSAAAHYWSRTAGASPNSTFPTSRAGTIFLPTDAAFRRLLERIGLPPTAAGMQRLLAQQRGLPAVGFSTVFDGFNASSPVAASLLHSALYHGFAGGVTVPASAFPAGPMPTLVQTYPPVQLGGVVAAAPGAPAVVMGRYNNATVVVPDAGVFCGGFVVHLIDEILWPSPTPLNNVVRCVERRVWASGVVCSDDD